jgi:FkbM family methyltransferase
MNKAGFKEKLKYLFLGYSHFRPSFSQAGEDMILRNIFRKHLNGTYVDVGAYHPMNGSNTYFFYRFMGWTGINIEPNPEQLQAFRKYRKKDINLNIGIGTQNERLKYYVIKNMPVMNSFSYDFIKESGMESHIEREVEVQVLPLSEVLNRHLNGRKIDMLNIDVEGMDAAALDSNDWRKYRPKSIVIESLIANWETSSVRKYLEEKDYSLVALTPVNIRLNVSCVFVENNFLKTLSNY